VDYLLFAIINLVIDSYFPQIDLIASSIRKIDQNLFDSRNKNLLKEIKTIRQTLNVYFNNLSPIRDIISRLISNDSSFVKPENVKYFKHAFNHTTFLCERINRLKESTSDIMNLNISMNGQKMNEIMKILTMISSIFIPLSFVCGLYGMNFNTEKSPFNMPELDWYYGYPAIVGFMLTLVIGIIVYFYKKKWF
ncbi:MAG: magnesium and cobalt transport protein CorA, partial [Oligoflexia bacterium]|nr:magnesium and cobalt transport protein CorA [Oligoflexia bacterium]